MKAEIKTSYDYIAGYRSELMGIAILLVIWFHTSISFDVVSNPVVKNILHYFKELGYGGVDLFLLVSGFGIWHSLRKHSVSRFYLNRLKKILPVWWGYMILKTVLEMVLFHTRIRALEILGFATFTGYWLHMDHQGNWFVYTIMLFYLISPVLCYFLYRSNRKTAVAFLLVLLATAASTVFFCDERLISFSRLPVYIVGIYLASDRNRFVMAGKNWLTCISIGVAGIIGIFVLYKCFDEHLWDYGIWWYPYIVLAPVYALLICLLFHLLTKRTALIGKAFRHLGEASLEILLVSDLSYTYLFALAGPAVNQDLLALLLMGFAIAAGLAIHFLIEQGKKQFFHFQH